jgi:predicted dehydrogenase
MKIKTNPRKGSAKTGMARRRFLKEAATGASLLACPAILRSASPNSRLQVACIGVGGMGGNTMKGVASHPKVKVVALCDVDQDVLSKVGADNPDASQHRDWRELLGEHADRYDAVTIGTPDHMHAAPAVVAMRARKHLYLQKPMAATLHECRVIAEEAVKNQVVTQLGNQGRSSIESRQTVELLRSGVIGRVQEVLMWENKELRWWPKNTELRTIGDSIPSGLAWDLWLGVRQPRPFLRDTYHPKNWRAWFDFGVGELGDMGCHHFDTTFDALKLTAPIRVRQTTPGSSGPLWGKQRVVELVFPGTQYTTGETLQVTWQDGGIAPDRNKIQLPRGESQLPASGTYWLGERGAIFKRYGGPPVVLPEANFPAEKYPLHLAPQDHYHDWVDAILDRRPACDEFTHGGPLTEAVLVGAMADRFAGQWLEWESASQRFTNSPAATALVRREYRQGWEVAGLG